MAYGNTNNNKDDKKKDLNTRSFQIYSEKGFDPSTLALGFWNQKYCTAKIHPALEENKRNEGSIYDYESNIGVVFEATHALALIEALEKKIIPAVESGSTDDVSVAVPLKGGVDAIEVGNGVKFKGQISPYFAIYKNINKDTKIPEQGIATEFLPAERWNGYDSNKGTFDVSTRCDDLYLFLEYLKSSVEGLSKANAHATRDSLKYIISKLMENQMSIMDKLGIEAKSGGYNRNSNTPRQIGGGGSSSSSTPASNIENMSVSDLEDGFEL